MIFYSKCRSSFSLLIIALVLTLISCQQHSSSKYKGLLRSEAPPNIILIFADDLSPQTLGIYGQKIIKTPRLDQMAMEGALFTKGYSAATSCAPSRLTLLLGRHLGHIDRRGNDDENRLLDSDVCFPELLRASGYRTAMFGKQHGAHFRNWFGLHTQVVGDIPSDNGFEEFVGTLKSTEAHQFFLDGVTNPSANNPKHLWRDQDGSISKYKIPAYRYTQNEYIDLALNYMESKKEEPFFMYLPLQSPHFEQVVPKQGDKDFKQADIGLLEQYLNPDGTSIFEEKPYLGTHPVNQRHSLTPFATYAGLISRLDRDVGLIIDKITSLGLAENTIVIFTADNGFGGWPSGGSAIFNPTGNLRAAKGSTYEGGVRVPFIFWGHDVSRSSIIEHPIIAYDLAPTILEYANVDQSFLTDGKSWKSALSSTGYLNHEFLYWENHLRNSSQAILLDNTFKIFRFKNDDGSYKIELYNIKEDESESQDLSKNPEMKSLLERADKIFIREHVPTEKYNM